MRIHRVFSPTPLRTGELVTLDEFASRHLLHSLRLGAGAEIALFDGSGLEYAARLVTEGRRQAQAEVGRVLRSESPPALRLHLAIGMSRGERMDFALQKAVELGAWELSPLFTERTLVRLRGARAEGRMAHWRGVIRHACEQSGRALLPRLYAPVPLACWLAGFQGRGLLLDHRAQKTLKDVEPPQAALSLLIGPEGGLSEAERDAAREAGLEAVCLGPRILRTETAPLAALAAIQTLWGDFCR